MRAVRIDCFGRGSNVMTPSGPVLLPPVAPLRLELVGETPVTVRLLAEDSLAESSGSVSGDPGESYPCIGLGGMGDGSPQR
jgi:hypothetical protein